MFPLLESVIDGNDTIFKYNRKQDAYSVIKAGYIMKIAVRAGHVPLEHNAVSCRTRYSSILRLANKNLSCIL